MIYLAFIVWMMLILLTGIGLYRLWTGRLKPAWVNWALLPGTVVSEMAYIFGCLITGGEVRHARLIDSGQGKAPARTETSDGVKFVGPLVASLMALVACIGAIILIYGLLGEPVLKEFGRNQWGNMLPKRLPSGWDALWGLLADQVHLARRTLETWGQVKWLNWRVPLFVYLSICLSVRLAPVSRPIRPTLVAAAALSAIIALVGLIWSRFTDLMDDIWPLLTYVWATLLVLLVLTLAGIGIAGLVRVLMGKEKK